MSTEHTQQDIHGRIAGIHLSSFLQMIEMEQKTCTVKVFTQNDMGRIYFLNGCLIDADTRTLKHLEAMYAILSWKKTVIEVGKNESITRNTIHLPLMHLLMESARLADEQSVAATEDPGRGPADVSGNAGPARLRQNRDFCLEIGVRIFMDPDGSEQTLQSALVGIEHGRYLLVKAPESLTSMEPDRINGIGLTLKSLYKGTIYAFRSRVLGLITHPSPLMFIEYPLKIEHHELRSSRRFRCNVAAQAEMEAGERGGIIENISKGGCFCVLETLKADFVTPDDLLNGTLVLRCRFPGSEDEVRFMGEVKNARRKSSDLGVGIQFLHLDTMDAERRKIHGYIHLIECSGEPV